MKTLKLIGEPGKRNKNTIRYHGRSGKPKIHESKTGKRYIMVRAHKGAGVKRLYEGSKYKDD